MDFLHKFNV